MRRIVMATLGCVVLMVASQLLAGLPAGTAFTWQGQLKQEGVAVTETIDLEASLWTAPEDGDQVGSTLRFDGQAGNPPPIDVVNGLFSVELDFGQDAFDGKARLLQIAVRSPHDPSDAAPYSILSPRQPVTPAPYALALPGLRVEQNETSANVIGGFEGNAVTPGVVGATISGGGQDGSANSANANFATVGGGERNRVGAAWSTVGGGFGNAASGDISTVGGGGTNTASGHSSTVGGGQSNTATASRATVGGGNSNTAGGSFSTVGGGFNNMASASISTVSGGGTNTASGTQSTVGGGAVNMASGLDSTVGGGSNNTASAPASTVGGGTTNTASGFRSTVGGGGFNTASGRRSTVGGGNLNMARGFGSTVPGGESNLAGGDYSFAAGQRAKVRDAATVGDTDGDQGTFVWADSTDADFVSTGADQFLIRAGGGVGINTNAPTEQLEVAGNAKVTGTIQSGNSITIDGTAGAERITSSNDLELHVATGRALRIESNATSPNVIGGFSGNTVSPGVVGATIGGGGGEDPFGGPLPNTVEAEWGTVGGGINNTASGEWSTVGGGILNTASGANSTVGGGGVNAASGECSVVAGGCNNSAVATGSFAAGQNARALHEGAFVWGGDGEAPVESTAPNEFTARTAGGVRFLTSKDASVAVRLSPGSGSWSAESDRNLKENVTEVDGREVLKRLAAVPIATWNYKAQDPSIRHIGPMGQDFHAAFGVGDEPPRINTIDADGVALAAVQGLYQIVKERDGEIEELRARLARLEQLVGGGKEAKE